MTGGHACALCRAPGVPTAHPVCDRCRRVLPARHRDHLEDAWRARITDPPGWQEALIAVLARRGEWR
ncbi:MAG: hypothetical protein M3N52_11960 [Actinomycetota bacterium]|nr:hypothetical protein [Actinomycetota bacterium]